MIRTRRLPCAAAGGSLVAPGPAPQPPETAAIRLAQLLELAKLGLAGAATDQTACSSAKSGKPLPGLKYREGRWAALHEVASHRRDRSGEVVTLASEVRSEWSVDLERRIQQGAGPDWIAYRKGGVDALAELLADPALSALTGPPPIAR